MSRLAAFTACLLLLPNAVSADAPDWRFIGAGRHAGPEVPWNDPAIPEELSAQWKSGTGRIRGVAQTGTVSIAGKNREWFGKELRWEVDTEQHLSSRIFITSRHLGVVDDRGPQGRIRILDRTGKIVASRSLLKRTQEVVYLQSTSGTVTISDLSGRQPTRSGKIAFPLTVTFGILVRTPDEECDSRIRVEEFHGLVPSTVEVDPIGAPKGILTGLSTRYYVWYSTNHWHIRTTSRKRVKFRGVIRVLNGQLAFARPVGLDRGSIDQWRYSAKDGELGFQFLSGNQYDGLDFRVVGPDSMVEFDLQTLGKKNPHVVFIGPAQKHPSSVPFAFPAQPSLSK